MYNKTAYGYGSNCSVIRELFEYGNRRAAIVGRENVFDYSLGNPSIPSPKEVNDAIRDVLADPCCDTNPAPVTREAVAQILQKAAGNG